LINKTSHAFLCLKPADRWTLTYLIATFPLLFIAEDVGSMIWAGALLRSLLIPFVIYFRQYCITKKPPAITYFYLEPKLLGRTLTLDINLLYFALDGFVVLVFVYLDSEAGQLILNLHGTIRYDDDLKRYEQEFFFGQPARELREWLPSRYLGEYLHFCYFTFYAIIVGMVFFTYFFRPREWFDRAFSALSLTFLTCFSVYLIYPVEGPYWTFPRPDPEQVSFFFGQVVQWVLVASSKGTAMPSSHCAISVVCWVSAWVYHVRLAIAYLFLVPGLIFATVWCGFHYGLDSTTGTIWGLLCSVAGILLAKYMPYYQPKHDNYYVSYYRTIRTTQGKWI